MIRLLLALAAVTPPMRFDHLPLGSAARVLSARYHTSITILANATVPVTEDFSQLTVLQALTLIAKQAGLVVRPDGTGFVIGPKLAEVAPGLGASSGRTGSGDRSVTAGQPVSPADQRAALLHRRAELLEQAAKLTAP
jgi:hypothetical protein